MNAGRREGDSIVGANRVRQPVLAKQPIEDGAHALAFGGEQAVARQQIARVLIGDRQGIAVDRVARAEVALEVGRPEIVGPGGRRGDDAGVLVVAAAPALLHQSSPSQQIPGGADRGPVHGGMAGPQPRYELGRAPARVLPSRRTNQRGDLGDDAVRAVMRRPTPLAKPVGAVRLIAREPLVAGLPADPVALAEFHHRIQARSQSVTNRMRLVMGAVSLQGMLTSLVSSLGGVTHVPGLMCYLCTRFVPGDA